MSQISFVFSSRARNNDVMKIILLSVLSALILSGCVSFDKDRAAERKKSELCRDIDTQNQPQCAGQYTPPPPDP